MSDADFAAIDWRGTTPHSARFGDIYFSPEDGLAESRHVFLGGIGAPDIWRGRDSFAIAETGFGTGLNFLLTWAAWRKTALPGARLDYVSVEGFPLSREDLSQALAAFPELAEEAAALIAAYPNAKSGFHRLDFDTGQVRLTLLLGEVLDMLNGLQARFDAWYLDGFAPSKNSEMWRPEVLARIGALSTPGAKLTTFTAAGAVRRGLAQVGFEMTKTKGFGQKRDSLRGTYAGETMPARAPWFRRPDPAKWPIAVIGGGVAGCAAARALHRAGFAVTIIDAADQLGAEASGNPAALFKPHLVLGDSPNARFHDAAFRYALRLYDGIAGAWLGRRGVRMLPRNDADAERFATLAEGDLAELDGGALLLPQAGCLDPVRICQELAGDLPRMMGCRIGALQRVGENWRLLDADGAEILTAGSVVLAAGPWTPRLIPDCELPIHANRGQIALLADRPDLPDQAQSFGGYLSSRSGTERVLGATFGRWPDLDDADFRQLRGEDQQACIDLAAPFFDIAEWRNAPLGGRAALRATTTDHLPLIGPAPDAAGYRAAYADLHHGRPGITAQAPYLPGLFVFYGFGSKGFSLAPLGAELLADLMTGAPLPVADSVHAALHPARFLVTELRRPPKALAAPAPAQRQGRTGRPQDRDRP